jgi:iron complex outermembrane receptor protein
VNAGRVRIRGLEFDAEYRIAEPLALRVAYAFTDARFTDFKQGPPSGSSITCGTPPGQFSSDLNRAEAGNVCGDLSGNVPGRSPRHALNIDVQYRQPVSAALEGFIEASSQFRSKRFLDETNLATLDSYWLFGLRAGVDSGNWSLWAYVDNLFDNDTVQTAQKFVDYARPDGFAPSRGVLAYLPEPRTLGIRGEVRF